MNEESEAYAVTNIQNKESFESIKESSLLLDKENDDIQARVDDDDIFEEASANPEDIDVKTRVLPEVTVSGARDDDKTYRKPSYFWNMDTDIKNINKMIRRHGQQSTKQLMNITLEKLKYFLNNLLRTVRITQTSHRILYLEPREILKPSLYNKVFMSRWL